MISKKKLAIGIVILSLCAFAPILFFTSGSTSSEHPVNEENEKYRSIITNLEQGFNNESIQYSELDSRNNLLYIEYARNYTNRSQLLREAGVITSMYADALNSSSPPYPDRLVANLKINDSSTLEYTADTELSLAVLNESINVTMYSREVLETFELKNDTR